MIRRNPATAVFNRRGAYRVALSNGLHASRPYNRGGGTRFDNAIHDNGCAATTVRVYISQAHNIPPFHATLCCSHGLRFATSPPEQCAHGTVDNESFYNIIVDTMDDTAGVNAMSARA